MALITSDCGGCKCRYEEDTHIHPIVIHELRDFVSSDNKTRVV